MGLRPDERQDFAAQFAAARTPSHREEILQRAAGFGPGEALAVMRLAEQNARTASARAGQAPVKAAGKSAPGVVPNVIRPPVAFAAPRPAPGVADDGPEIALPAERPVMVEMKPEDRARAAAERAFAGAPPAAPAKRPPAPPVGRQPVAAAPQAPPPDEPDAPAPQTPQQAQRDAFLQRKFAQDLLVRHGHLLPPGPNNEPNPYAAAITEAGNLPGGMAALRRFAIALRTQDLENRKLAAKQRANNYNITQDMRNPNIGPGMRLRGLQAAVQAGDDRAIAAAHEIAGNPMGAARATNVLITREAGQAQAEAARAEAAGNADPATPPKPIGEQISEQLAAALAIENPNQRRMAVVAALKQLPQNEGLTLPKLESLADETIAAHVFRQDANDPAVQAHLNTLRRNKPAFKAFAMKHLNMTEPQAELFYNSGQPAPQQQGQQAAQNAVDWGRRAGNWIHGFWQGATGAAPPKPQG